MCASWEQAVGEVVSPFGYVPGETPIIDRSGLRRSAKWIKTRAQLNGAEADGVRRAATKYLVGMSRATILARFDLNWSYKLHREMLGHIWRWAGKRRAIEVQPVGEKPYNIEPSLYSLLLDLETWTQTGMDRVEQAARLHHRAAWIHPFLNGNGRWARLLANVWLKKNGHGIIVWPDEHIVGCESAERQEYIDALKAADDGDMGALLEMHRRYLTG